MTYNLEERTALFSEKIIEVCQKIRQTPINAPLINQLIRSSSSIGANYCEANGASSRKDFKNKIHICKKKTIETKYWLRLIAKTDSNLIAEFRNLWKEAQELTLIFSKILGTINKNNK